VLRETLSAALPDFATTIAGFAGEMVFADAAIVAGYLPIREEADPRALMAALAKRGHRLALPCMAEGKRLVFRAWREGDATQLNVHGIGEPASGGPAVTPELVLVPLLAFDAHGHRLGYGGGYYDRALDRLRAGCRVTAIGIAYAGQEVDALPREPHDHRLDLVVTERGIRHFES